MTTPSTYAGSEENELSCLAARSHILDDVSPPALDVHLATCEPCALLAADHALLAHALQGVPELQVDFEKMAAAVHSQVQQESGLTGTVQRWSTSKRITALMAASVFIIAATGLVTPRVDLEVYPVERMATIVVTLLVAGGLTLFRGLRALSHSRTTPWLILTIGLLLPFFYAGLPAAHVDHPDALIDGNFIAKTTACFAFGAVVAAAIGKLAHWFDRRSHIDLQAGMVIAAAGGIIGNLALQLHCPITDPMHLLLGHASVGAVLVAGLALALTLRR